MKFRWLWTIILLIVAFGVLFFNRSLAGLLVGAVCLVILLFIWAHPRKTTTDDTHKREKPAAGMTRSLLGLGLGLLAAMAAILLLPPQAFLWVSIIVGIALIAWFVIQFR